MENLLKFYDAIEDNKLTSKEVFNLITSYIGSETLESGISEDSNLTGKEMGDLFINCYGSQLLDNGLLKLIKERGYTVS